MDWLVGFYNYRVVAAYLPKFAAGLAVTIQVSASALAIALLLGVLIAAARCYAPAAVGRAAAAYVEAVRATPLLIQLYLLYFAVGALPFYGRLSELQAGILALGLNGAAYFSEIVRAGLQAIPVGQVEAARSLGLGLGRAVRLVVLPQAVRAMMPPLLGQTAMLIKDSSIVSFVGVVELTGVGVALMSDRLLPNEGFLSVALCYLAIYVAALGLIALATRRAGMPGATRRGARAW
jgi:polar amino acid transport system permease protein